MYILQKYTQKCLSIELYSKHATSNPGDRLGMYAKGKKVHH